MKRSYRWLLTALCMVSTTAALAQNGQTTMLEITDVSGDVQTTPLKAGMTLYWPQLNYSSDWGFAVLCEKDGKPVLSIPINFGLQLATLKVLNAPATSKKADMSGYQEVDTHYDSAKGVRFDIGGQTYTMHQLGELQFSSPLGSYELITATGEHYTVPLAETSLIHCRDTILGVGDYLKKMLDHQIYQWTFYEGKTSSQQYLYENFYAMFPEATNYKISMFLPTDEAFKHVPFILSTTSRYPCLIDLTYNASNNFPLIANLYRYDFSTGVVGNLLKTVRIDQTCISDYLISMLRSHVILHDGEINSKAGLNSGNDYFIALDGSPLRVVRKDGKVVGMQSAFHLWNQKHGITTMSGEEIANVSLTQANIISQRAKGNGVIYAIDNTLEATPSSVYSILSGSELAEGEENPFSRFFDICQKALPVSEDSLNKLSYKEREAILARSSVFVENGGLHGSGLNFVGNMPFTLYVPTNEAIENEVLEGHLATALDSLNFVKAHIHFGLELADQQAYDRTHNTVMVKPGTLTTPKLRVRGLGDGKMTVTDECGNTRNVIATHNNIFVREAHCTRTSGDVYSPNNKLINGVSLRNYAVGVIHQIDGVLRYNK